MNYQLAAGGNYQRYSVKKTTMRVPVKCFLFLLAFDFFFLKPGIEQVIPVVKYADEFVAALAFPIGFVSLLYKDAKADKFQSQLLLMVTAFAVVGLLGNAFFQYQPFVSAVLPDTFLNLKFWLALYVGSFLSKKICIEKYATLIFNHIKLITWVFVGLIITDYLFDIFPGQIRYGLKSMQLFYGHPTGLAANCVLMLALLISISKYKPRQCRKYFAIWILFMCLTLRSKAFGAALAITFIYYFCYIKKRKLKISELVVVGILALIGGWSQVQDYFFSAVGQGWARYQLLEKSFEIAIDHFPIGSGFGTFASWYSGTVYSPLYYTYNLSNVYGLNRGNADFVSDSFWPMIIGQTGCVGVILFVSILIIMLKKIRSLYLTNRERYTASLILLAYILVSSIAESAFVNPLTVPMALFMGYLFNDKQTSIENR